MKHPLSLMIFVLLLMSWYYVWGDWLIRGPAVEMVHEYTHTQDATGQKQIRFPSTEPVYVVGRGKNLRPECGRSFTRVLQRPVAEDVTSPKVRDSVLIGSVGMASWELILPISTAPVLTVFVAGVILVVYHLWLKG